MDFCCYCFIVGRFVVFFVGIIYCWKICRYLLGDLIVTLSFCPISWFLSLFMKSEMVIWWKALNIEHFDQMILTFWSNMGNGYSLHRRWAWAFSSVQLDQNYIRILYISVLFHPCGWSCARLFENILSIGLENVGLENKVLVTVLLKILVLSEPSKKWITFETFRWSI